MTYRKQQNKNNKNCDNSFASFDNSAILLQTCYHHFFIFALFDMSFGR